MADDRNRDRMSDPQDVQDGLGRDTAHGGAAGGTGSAQGGSVGRRTMGNAGDDLLGIDADAQSAAGAQGADDATDHQREAGMRREGLEGKGFDAGSGYGGGGSASLYSSESSFGGQAGGRDSSLRGAYSGDDYGRKGDDDQSSGGMRDSAEIQRGSDEQAMDGRSSGGGGASGDDPIDMDERPDVSRRDPTR